MSFQIRIALSNDAVHASTLVDWYLTSSKERGTGIATRTATYLINKINNGDAVIALADDQIVGFSYIETFEGKKYVSNSGLIIKKECRGKGLAKLVKAKVFNLARDKYPAAKIFGITTSDIVMNINTQLGYRPAAFSQLTSDDAFWNGCSSCPNYDILLRNDKKMCLCTGLLAPSKNELNNTISENKKEISNDK